MTDYTKVCWSCGQETMVEVSYWHKCSSCGATHVPAPETSFSPLTVDYIPADKGKGLRREKIRRVSGRLAHNAAKARQGLDKQKQNIYSIDKHPGDDVSWLLP